MKPLPYLTLLILFGCTKDNRIKCTYSCTQLDGTEVISKSTLYSGTEDEFCNEVLKDLWSCETVSECYCD